MCSVILHYQYNNWCCSHIFFPNISFRGFTANWRILLQSQLVQFSLWIILQIILLSPHFNIQDSKVLLPHTHQHRKAALYAVKFLSAAFDTADHNILLKCLEELIGLTGPGLNCFTTYLNRRQHFVRIGDHVSKTCCLLWCTTGFCARSPPVHWVKWLQSME